MKKVVTDQMERQVEIPFPPRRIVSLVPSQTELLFHLGLDEEVVGITKFCVHPEEKWRTKPRIGGTKKLHFDRIAERCPDLIIGNKEENERSQIEELEKKYAVWMSDISNVEDALEMIQSVGAIVGKRLEAEVLSTSIRQSMNAIEAPKARKPAAYFIWRRPWMVAGGGTFIDSMMQCAGFENVFGSKTRYPEITLGELSEANPETILLSSEPYPFQEKHLAELKKQCPEAAVKLVDGELFSWYGSRMLKAAPYFTKLRSEI